MAATFEQGLQSQLDADDTLRRSAFGRRAARVLALPPSNLRRAKVLARMESHATAHIGKPVADWNKVGATDWTKIIELLVKILPLILSLFGL